MQAGRDGHVLGNADAIGALTSIPEATSAVDDAGSGGSAGGALPASCSRIASKLVRSRRANRLHHLDAGYGQLHVAAGDKQAKVPTVAATRESAIGQREAGRLPLPAPCHGDTSGRSKRACQRPRADRAVVLDAKSCRPSITVSHGDLHGLATNTEGERIVHLEVQVAGTLLRLGLGRLRQFARPVLGLERLGTINRPVPTHAKGGHGPVDSSLGEALRV